MADAREMGVPSLRRRTDRGPEAMEWNRMVDAINGLYDSRTQELPLPVGRPVCGFSPIIHVDADGVGLQPGYLIFHQTRRFTTAAGTDKEATEIMPTLGGTALDAATPPRSTLAEGDWEAWVVWSEIETGNHEARIEFVALGTGAGTLDRDEKATRLCSFEVIRNGSRHAVVLYEQFVSCQLIVPTEVHQFRAFKTDDAKLKVATGYAIFLEGTTSPLVSNSLSIPESNEFTITESGSIWLDLSATVDQHSTTSALIRGGSPADYVRLKMYRITALDSPNFIFRGSTVNSPNPPTFGNNTTDVWNGTVDLRYEVCKVELVGGEVFITDQIIEGPLHVTDLVDGALDAYSA